jgi:cyanophycinase
MTTLMAIGGAINIEEPAIFEEFIRRAGGKKARILVLPQASSLSNAGSGYSSWLKKLGARAATALEFRDRYQADRSQHLEALRKATGIFITGGVQLRLTSLLGGTKFERELLAAYRRGTVIAGTSAGAAVQSRSMIAEGRRGPTPRQGMAQFSSGFGFTDRILFDQHFRQRDRLGRLIYGVCMNPGALGVGVDENTAAIVEEDRLITVCGKHAITIVDGTSMRATNVPEVTNSHPIAASGLTIHVLTTGCSFDLKTRKAMIPRPALSKA